MKKISIRMRFSLMISALVLVCMLINTGFTVFKIQEVAYHSKEDIAENKEKADKNAEVKANAKKEQLYNNALSNYFANDINKEDDVKLTASTDAGRAYDKAVAIMEEGYDEIISSQIETSFLISVVALFISYWISGCLLKPFKELVSDIEGVNASNLKDALSIEQKDDEISQIKQAINVTFNKLNEALNRQRNFTSNVSHELKTPLAVMKAYAQILDEDSTKEEFLIANNVQLKNIDRMNNLINDFMTYVSNDEIVYETVNLKNTIDELVEDFKEIASDKHIEFEVSVPNITVESNEILLRRLISNLIKNAIKYNKTDGKIFITYEKNTLTVRDTGIGIPEDKLEDIFEPLFCVDQSRSRELGGSGLGLAIVKNICDVLGYKIEVYSKLTHGTEFIIKL